MALRAVPDHPKFADFKHRLNLSKGAALGFLECIWHFAGRFTPAGNIGKYQDSAIEAWVEWDGEPGALVKALIDSHWAHYHEDPAMRVVIHDWADHADEIVNTVLARNCQLFWDGTPPRSGKLNQYERERYNHWMEAHGHKHRPSHRPAKNQPERSQNADKSPKPAPAPAPAPALAVVGSRALLNNRTVSDGRDGDANSSGNGTGEYSPDGPSDRPPNQSHDSKANGHKPEHVTNGKITEMSNLLHATMQNPLPDRPPRIRKPPDRDIVIRCLKAANGVPMDSVARFLRSLQQSMKIPEHGPRKYAWFESVFAEEFGGRV